MGCVFATTNNGYSPVTCASRFGAIPLHSPPPRSRRSPTRSPIAQTGSGGVGAVRATATEAPVTGQMRLARSLLVRRVNGGGAENAAYDCYPPDADRRATISPLSDRRDTKTSTFPCQDYCLVGSTSEGRQWRAGRASGDQRWLAGRSGVEGSRALDPRRR